MLNTKPNSEGPQKQQIKLLYTLNLLITYYKIELKQVFFSSKMYMLKATKKYD